MTDRLVVDCSAQTAHTVPLTEQQTADLAAEQLAHQSVQAAQLADAATLRSAVQTQLTGIPGTAWTALTAAQKQAVIVALLFKSGALDKTLTVQPLANWL